MRAIIKNHDNGLFHYFKDRIFQPFFTTKPTGEGTGLGLSMSYDIITKGHGGKLKVKSSTGADKPHEQRGSTFVIHLPIEKQ